jgi:prophage tail gpP-like protein
MPFILKINVRSSRTGPPVRTIRRFNNLVFNRKFNSLASTFSFNFYFDPNDQNSAEIICVSHVHECVLYYTTNREPNYEPNKSERVLTGYLLRSKFRNNGQPQWVQLSGYSKPGVLTDCDYPPDQYPLEIDGLTLRQIVRRAIQPFGLELVSNRTATSAGKKFVVEDVDEDDSDDDDEDGEDSKKTAADSSENIASHLSGLAKMRNVVLSHNSAGNVYITTPNTKNKPIITLDFLDSSSPGIKIPGLDVELDFNAQGLHSHITVKQQASEEEEDDGQEVTIRNPLLPVKAVKRPKVCFISEDGETTVRMAALYELGKEIRENVPLTVRMGQIEFDGKLIAPNETIAVRDPSLYLYNLCAWFIQDCEIKVDGDEESCVANCVLTFGYDFDEKTLKNVFVDPHENFGITR